MNDNRADLLHDIERALVAISAEQHELARSRTVLTAEATRLRLTFSYEDRVRYEGLKLAERLETEVRA